MKRKQEVDKKFNRKKMRRNVKNREKTNDYL